jgi:hypothetical protein
MIHCFLNLLIDEFQDKIFQFAFQILFLEHFQQRGVHCSHTVMASQSQVCEILAKVVHHNDFVFKYRFDLHEFYTFQCYLPPSA